jgi:hypothetical protein
MPSYKDTSKPWFETGDYPTQSQFWQTFDRIRWKDEPISMAEVEGLIAQLNALSRPDDVVVCDGGPVLYTIPPGYKLVSIEICTPVGVAALQANFTFGATGVIIPEMELSGPESFPVNILAAFSAKGLSITGLNTGTKVLFEKRKINI